MRISTFFYTIRQGFRNIFRNKLFSLASIATITACLFMLGVVYSIVLNAQHMVKTAEQGVSVTVFFKDGTTDDRVKEIGDEITKKSRSFPKWYMCLRMRYGPTLKKNILENMQMDLQKIRLPIRNITRSICGMYPCRILLSPI